MILTEYNEKQHMKMIRRDARLEGLEEGLEEGLQKGRQIKTIEQVRNKYNKNLSVNMIAEHLDEPVDYVERVCTLINEHPRWTIEEIYSGMYNQTDTLDE